MTDVMTGQGQAASRVTSFGIQKNVTPFLTDF